MRSVSPWALLPMVLGLLCISLPGCRVGEGDLYSTHSPPTALSQAMESTENRGEIHESGPTFYPLSIGNRWVHARISRLQVFDLEGNPTFDLTNESDNELEMIGYETIGDRRYVVGEWRQDPAPPDFLSWVRYRQDRTGLYEADVSTLLPPVLDGPSGPWSGRLSAAVGHGRDSGRDRVPAGIPAIYREAWLELSARAEALHALGSRSEPGIAAALMEGTETPDELLRYRYPLHRFATWVIREDPLFAYAVEGNEVVSVPAGRFQAWRLRIDAQFLRPGDEAHVWVGRAGEIRFESHLTAPTTDETGTVIGTAILDQWAVLKEVHLARK